MSFFNKMFASVGIGSATVDTKLEKDAYMPGDEVSGEIVVTGGNVDQDISDIYLSLNTYYLKESNDRKHNVTASIERYRLTEPFTIAKNDRKEIPFSIKLPEDTPLSIGRTNVWVTTGLDIKNAIDPSDKDYLKIIPSPLVTSVFQSMEDLGFRLREAECEEAPHRLRRRFPFVQEFEFVPISGPFRGRLDELEIIFYPSSQKSMDLLLQVDRRARGLGGLLAEALEMDETNVRITVTAEDVPYLTQKLQSVFQQYA
jgi:sporulation-control protein